MNILNLLLFIWLLVLTVMVIFSYRTRIIYIKKIKNKRDTRAKRYVIFDIISEDNFEIREIEEAVRNSVKELGGKIWLDLSNPKVIMIYNNRGIISTNRIGYKIIIASLPLIKKIKNKEVLLVPRRTTGSLKRAKRLIGIE